MHAVAPTMSSSPPDTGRRRRSPWQVVIGGGFASAVGPAQVGLSTLSLFVVPISLEMGFGRTIVTSAYTVGALGVAVMWEAVIADVGVALLATLNATRAMGGKAS